MYVQIDAMCRVPESQVMLSQTDGKLVIYNYGFRFGWEKKKE